MMVLPRDRKEELKWQKSREATKDQDKNSLQKHIRGTSSW